MFRLCRIVYPNYRWLQADWVYLTIFLIELIVILILVSPILFWNDVIYLPEESYCYVPFTNSRGILWLLLNAYGNPLLILLWIYIRITVYLRQQSSTNLLPIIKQRQDRDLLVIRRIFIIIGFLLALGLPGVVLLIMLYITGEQHPLVLRIEWFSVSISMVELTLTLILFTSQLKRIIWKIFQKHRVGIIINGSLPLQNISPIT